MIIISILSLVCKQLAFIYYEIKTGHLFYLRTVVTFRQHNTASPATIFELLIRIKIVEIMKEEGAHELLISTPVDT